MKACWLGQPGAVKRWASTPARANSGAVERGGVVVADFADVTRAQAPVLAGDHGRWQPGRRAKLALNEFDFGAAGGIVRDGDEGVSVALRPTPTTSSLGECVMMVPATVKEAREFSKA